MGLTIFILFIRRQWLNSGMNDIKSAQLQFFNNILFLNTKPNEYKLFKYEGKLNHLIFYAIVKLFWFGACLIPIIIIKIYWIDLLIIAFFSILLMIELLIYNHRLSVTSRIIKYQPISKPMFKNINRTYLALSIYHTYLFILLILVYCLTYM